MFPYYLWIVSIPLESIYLRIDIVLRLTLSTAPWLLPPAHLTSLRLHHNSTHLNASPLPDKMPSTLYCFLLASWKSCLHSRELETSDLRWGLPKIWKLPTRGCSVQTKRLQCFLFIFYPTPHSYQISVPCLMIPPSSKTKN